MLSKLRNFLLISFSEAMKIFTICIVVTSTGGYANTQINISGSVLAAPLCVINGNKTITVDFGNHINGLLVNGVNYVREIDYKLDCTNFSSNTMRLMLEGTGASFNNDVLLTNNPDLAISIKANGQGIAINKWFTFVYPTKPALQAVLVKRTGVNLTPGYFSAVATLKVDYQ